MASCQTFILLFPTGKLGVGPTQSTEPPDLGQSLSKSIRHISEESGTPPAWMATQAGFEHNSSPVGIFHYVPLGAPQLPLMEQVFSSLEVQMI